MSYRGDHDMIYRFRRCASELFTDTAALRRFPSREHRHCTSLCPSVGLVMDSFATECVRMWSQTRREPHVPMPGGRGGVAQVEQVNHPPPTAAGKINTEDHVAAALQPSNGPSATHTSSGRRLPTAGGGSRWGDGTPPPFTPKSLSVQQEYYAVKWGALSRGVTPKVLVTVDSRDGWH